MKLQRGAHMALIALQGPKAEAALAKLAPAVRDIPFMHYAAVSIDGIQAHVSRSGYTGEDGFEISIFDKDAVRRWQLLLANPDVKPIGLGARDSLRLEAGLCLYGHDIDETTSPVEADLLWSIHRNAAGERWLHRCRRIHNEIAQVLNASVLASTRRPARPPVKGTSSPMRAAARSGNYVRGFGPTANGPVAMGHVETAFATAAPRVQLIVRDKPCPPDHKLPFVPHNYNAEEIHMSVKFSKDHEWVSVAGISPRSHHQSRPGAIGRVVL